MTIDSRPPYITIESNDRMRPAAGLSRLLLALAAPVAALLLLLSRSVEAAVADAAAAGSDTVGVGQPQPRPLLVPLRRATQAPPSIPGDARKRLLRRKRGKGGPAGPAINASSLQGRPKVQFGYIGTMNLPGNQVVEVLPDTGSSQLWLPTTICPACNQVILDRTHPDLKAVRPVVDIAKARATYLNCTSERCVGKCTPELLKKLNIEDKDTSCAPHGGVCTAFMHPGDFSIQGACAFNATYGDGSTQLGALVQGPVEFGGVQLQNMTYGALVMGSTHTLFEPGGGGVLGLRPGICHESALSCYPSFLDTMAAETGLPKIVTFCGHNERPLVVLGGGDERLRVGPVLYAPMKGRNDTYTVGIDSATLGDAPLPVPSNATAFIDTGTSLAYLPKEFFEAIAKALQEPKYCQELALPHLCPTDTDPRTIFDGKDDPLPFNATDIAKFPTLVLKLPGDGATLELKGDDYLQNTGSTDPATGLSYYSLAIGAGKRANMFLLGQVFLRKYYTEFDVQNGRLGFAPAVPDCQKAVGL